MTTTETARPGFVGRLRSRQAGLPSGLLGRLVGRLMVKDTADTNDRALAKLDLTHPRTILDVGFGQGRTVAVLVRAGHRALGVDPSPTMVKQATARNRAACRDGRATLRQGDGITVPFPDDSADGAITAHTIYFMPDPAATIADIARVLRPGGTLVIACRTSDDATPAWIDLHIYRIRSADEITEMLRVAGFDTVDHEPGDAGTHAIHLFVARLATDTGTA
jgi:ubiquinone/menaquinone biosynthesis C-methylase UbiE